MNQRDTYLALPPGYMGKILTIDLTHRSFGIAPLDRHVVDLFFGGRGLGIYFLWTHFLRLQAQGRYKNAFVEVDPLGPDNGIIITTSPTTGTQMPTSGRIHMNFKSPLTMAYGSTSAGGRYGTDLKRAGYDAVLVTGSASEPVFLVVSRDGVVFSDAGAESDLDSVETREALKNRYASKAQVLSIGTGGKKGVRFASVMSDTGKALGRSGGGAVWGSKNLYAMVVIPDANREIPVADKDSLDARNEGSAMYRVQLKLDSGKLTKREASFGVLQSMGSLGMLGMVDNYNQLIHNNMRDTTHRREDIEKINGEALRYHYQNARVGEKKIAVKKGTCFNCPIACKRQTTLLDENDNVIETGEGPEFESTTLLGANLSIYDLPLIKQANTLANRYGLDTISLGATIAAFFDLHETLSSMDSLTEREAQLFTDAREFTDEFGEPGFGKVEMLLPLIRRIGESRGIGVPLGKGSYRFCKRYGHEELSMSVKRLELPAYDPRVSYTQALCYEMSSRGGCHLEGGYTAPQAYCAGYGEWPGQRIEGSPLISKNAALKNTSLDIIGACAFGSFSLGLDEYASLVNAVTGLTHDLDSLKTLALRTLTLERQFNNQCGLTDDDDWLPDRFYSESIQTEEGDVVCRRSDFEKMHREYYLSLGWDAVGVPTAETLGDLNLTEIVAPGTGA